MRIVVAVILVCAVIAYGAPANTSEDVVPDEDLLGVEALEAEAEAAEAEAEAAQTQTHKKIMTTGRYSHSYCNRPRYSGYFGGRGKDDEIRGPSYCSGEHADGIAKMHYEQCRAGGFCPMLHPKRKMPRKKYRKYMKKKKKKKAVKEIVIKRAWGAGGLSVPGLTPVHKPKIHEPRDSLDAQLGKDDIPVDHSVADKAPSFDPPPLEASRISNLLEEEVSQNTHKGLSGMNLGGLKRKQLKHILHHEKSKYDQLEKERQRVKALISKIQQKKQKPQDSTLLEEEVSPNSHKGLSGMNLGGLKRKQLKHILHHEKSKYDQLEKERQRVKALISKIQQKKHMSKKFKKLQADPKDIDYDVAYETELVQFTQFPDWVTTEADMEAYLKQQKIKVVRKDSGNGDKNPSGRVFKVDHLPKDQPDENA